MFIFVTVCKGKRGAAQARVWLNLEHTQPNYYKSYREVAL